DAERESLVERRTRDLEEAREARRRDVRRGAPGRAARRDRAALHGPRQVDVIEALEELRALEEGGPQLEVLGLEDLDRDDLVAAALSRDEHASDARIVEQPSRDGVVPDALEVGCHGSSPSRAHLGNP